MLGSHYEVVYEDHETRTLVCEDMDSLITYIAASPEHAFAVATATAQSAISKNPEDNVGRL